MRTSAPILLLVLSGCPAGSTGGDGRPDAPVDPFVVGDGDSDSDENPVVAAHDELCEEPERMLGAWCEFDGDCCEGQACVSGECAAPPDGPCEDHDDCPVGFECVDGGCRCVGEHCDDGDDCPEDPPRLAGSWDFQSRLDVSGAVADWILWIGDAAAVGCDWADEVAWLADVPAWAPDLLCLVADITAFMDDMEVAHLVRTVAADDVTWAATDTWTAVTFDPDGERLEIDPRRLECPIEVDDFSVRWSCGDTFLDRHEVHLPVNGLVKLALDAAACGAMGGAWGCSWDAAMDELCAGIDDPFLIGACEDVVDSLVIPDPCFEVNTMTLAGTAVAAGPDDLSGDWAGTLDGEDFTGTFAAARR